MAWVTTAIVLLIVLGAGSAAAGDAADLGQAQAKFDTPLDKGAAAAPKNTAPASKTPAPASKTAGPASKTIAPAPKSAAPASKTVAPAVKSAAPANKGASPAKHDGAQPAGKRGDGTSPRTGGRVRCLSQNETRDTVSARKLSAPFSALRTAGAHARGETVGVRLCRHNEDYIYEVNVLRRDGRVVKVVVDAASGKIVRLVNDR